MSDTSDIKILTINTKTVFKTSAAIERVKIHNNSSFFLRVYFGADAPNDPIPGGGWHDTIDPGGTPLMWIVGASSQAFENRSYVQSTPYQGVITIMPFLPVGLPSPIGVITGASLAYITGYYPGEWAQEGGEIEAYVQAAKQARYQVIEGGVSRAIATLTNQHANNIFLGPQIQLLSSTMPNLFDRNAQGVSAVNVYVYSCLLNIMNLGSLVGEFDGFLALDVRDSTAAIVRASSEFFRYQFVVMPNSWPAPQQQVIIPMFQGPTPLWVQLSMGQGVLQNGDIITMSHHITSSVGTWQNHINASLAVDTVNQTPLLTFPFPANPAYAINNPQTY